MIEESINVRLQMRRPRVLRDTTALLARSCEIHRGHKPRCLDHCLKLQGRGLSCGPDMIFLNYMMRLVWLIF